MNSTMMDIRTVALVKDLTTETRHGANGDFESKTILFRIATDRNYRVSKTVNGQTTMEYPTDFYLAKATGGVAESLAKFCTAKKEDGKLVSRRLLVTGSFETYQKDVVEHVEIQNVNINGMLYNVQGDVTLRNRTQTIFVIDNFSFLDKNPANNQQNAAPQAAPVAAPATAPVMAGQPVQQYAPQTVQQGAPVMAGAPVQAPAQQYAPAAPAAQGAPVMAGQQVPAATPATPAPAAPTVAQGFVNSGGTAPF